MIMKDWLRMWVMGTVCKILFHLSAAAIGILLLVRILSGNAGHYLMLLSPNAEYPSIPAQMPGRVGSRF